MSYAELQVTSHFSFLRGASSPQELFAAAAVLGVTALGVCDRNSLAGIVQAHRAAAETGVKLVIGCRMDLDCGTSVLVYPTDRLAYGRLCRLLSLGKARAGKGSCDLGWVDVEAWSEGLLGLLVCDEPDATCEAALRRLQDTFGDRAYAAISPRLRPNDVPRRKLLVAMAARLGVPAVATNDVLFHVPERRILQDVVTCIREGCTIDEAGFRRERFADRHLKSAGEMAFLFAGSPDLVARTLEVADRAQFSLDELKYQYPTEALIPGLSAQEALARLTWEGAAARFGGAVPGEVERQLRHELRLIEELGYAPYFLTVNSIVRFARGRGILCQGRGSAANSAVCYVLGITSIDPVRSELLFERFVSAARDEPPDIDVDFEHERREEVIQWIYRTYGRERAALCATVNRFRPRGAVREVGKVLGLSNEVTGALAKQVWAWSGEGVEDKHAAELGLNLSDRRLSLTLELARQLVGTPRHLGQHPGGFVLTRDRLDELVPIEPARMADRQVIEWDKDDIDTLRMMKVDVLGLGMLGCMRRAFELLRQHKGEDLDLSRIPAEDPRTYAMIRKADTLGVFQIESRAQMAMLPRIKPRTFYDLVVEVALVRPGPIQGDMVHPYLRRREGLEPVSFPTSELKAVLGKTLGVPLFQEQAMKVAIVCAGFTATEADQLRRAMATFKFTGGVSHFRDKLVAGMVANGYDAEFAERTFKQIEGFGSYGFPESHAASFALIAYASSWMKCHHPEVFCAALLNAQPMGFYAPAQIVRDAQAHGVEVRSVCINASRWDCGLEELRDGRLAVRLGLRMVKGLSNVDAARIVAARGASAFNSIEEVWRRAQVPVLALERLANADAFLASLGVDRRRALWLIHGLRSDPLPLFQAAEGANYGFTPEIIEPHVTLERMRGGGEVVEDYRSIGLTLRQHPIAFLRSELEAEGVAPCSALRHRRDGRRITVAGLVLVRQKPGTAKGVLFLTLEDEDDIANVIVWPDLFERQRRLLLAASMLKVFGRVQREGDVIHLIADRIEDATHLLRDLENREISAAHEGSDEGPAHDARISVSLPVATRDFR